MNENKKHLCPVCGFEGLDEPPITDGNPSHEICPCCGFEFGFDEAFKAETYKSYRECWIAGGAQWTRPELKPCPWSLDKQLEHLKKISNE